MSTSDTITVPNRPDGRSTQDGTARCAHGTAPGEMVASGGVLVLLAFGAQTFVLGLLHSNAAAALLFAGVVRVIAKELPGPSVSRAVS